MWLKSMQEKKNAREQEESVKFVMENHSVEKDSKERRIN